MVSSLADDEAVMDVYLGPTASSRGAMVVGMDSGNVDSVFVAGRVMKQDLKLAGVNWAALMDAASDARDRVLAKSGFQPPKL